MSTYGFQLQPLFGLESRQEPVRLTRRGRIARSVVMGAAVAAIVGSAASALLDGQARADVQVPAMVSPAAHEVVVEEGDSLWGIARRHAPGVDPREVVVSIREINGMRSNLIQPGQVLLVPSGL